MLLSFLKLLCVFLVGVVLLAHIYCTSLSYAKNKNYAIYMGNEYTFTM